MPPMSILDLGELQIEYMDEGSGPAVLLLHSSASGNWQWQGLTGALRGRRRVIAPNLFGYGSTSPWHAKFRQRITDQAGLVCAALKLVDGPIDIVGHSFGATVALEAAAMLGNRSRRLVLFEPNPFALLDHPDYLVSYLEVHRLYQYVQQKTLQTDWLALAERFSDYFSGDGSWNALPAERRTTLARSLAANKHEWDAVMDADLRPPRWKTVKTRTLLVWARDTRASLRGLVDILLQEYPHWASCEIERGGHMAPLTRARAFNAHVQRFLDEPE